MPTTEQDARPAAVAALRFLAAEQELWHGAFPGLHRRAQPQIIAHLGTRARTGAAVGALHGLVKQIFLLDDSTVKERIQEIARAGLCELDPPGDVPSTRTVVVPTGELLARYDGYLAGLALRLAEAAESVDPVLAAPAVPGALTAAQRGVVLRALEGCSDAWRAALERFLAALSLSPARRVEAIRNLHATSHATLLHMAVARRHGLSPLADAEPGLLADRMAAALLDLIGQNFQTTRDHLGYLLEVGLLTRLRGKALRVALSDAAAAPFDAALAEIAAALPGYARALADGAPAGPLPPAAQDAPASALVHELLVAIPGRPPHRVPLLHFPFTIGRSAPCDLLLPGADVSRQHCRLEMAGTELRVTDLESTNGTIMDGRRIAGSVTLRPAATVRVGTCQLTYECRPQSVATTPAEAETTERTMRAPVLLNKAGNSAH